MVPLSRISGNACVTRSTAREEQRPTVPQDDPTPVQSEAPNRRPKRKAPATTDPTYTNEEAESASDESEYEDVVSDNEWYVVSCNEMNDGYK